MEFYELWEKLFGDIELQNRACAINKGWVRK